MSAQRCIKRNKSNKINSVCWWNNLHFKNGKNCFSLMFFRSLNFQVQLFPFGLNWFITFFSVCCYCTNIQFLRQQLMLNITRNEKCEKGKNGTKKDTKSREKNDWMLKQVKRAFETNGTFAISINIYWKYFYIKVMKKNKKWLLQFCSWTSTASCVKTHTLFYRFVDSMNFTNFVWNEIKWNRLQ